ncbi:MAG TPA: response regulator, partial [Chryseosolibacter sp.]|nr:response regulator [Chryseosolibacter sp.]
LVGNAIKFTHHGEVFIGVHLLELKNDFARLEFEVRDTGIGIPDDKLNRLFKAFSQVDSSTTRKYGGTGLGLVICEKLVALMGGNIRVQSQPGAGTTFTFTVETHVSQQSIRTHVHYSTAGIHGKKVLIVDDNSTNRMILKTQMEQWKMLPVLAETGVEAVSILSSGIDFDLVITDMQMPEMDGIELGRYVRDRFPRIPVVLLSSLGDERCRTMTTVFSAVLTKPVKQAVLLRNIVATLRPQTLQAEPHPDSERKLSDDFSLRFPLRILIAEDNLVNIKLAERVLKKLGYTPEIAMNGHEVIELVAKMNFDVILMDIQMPVMDGLEATAKIRLTNGSLPIIVAMTANAMPGDRETCMQAGMDDYISKPIKIDALTAVLEKWGNHFTDKRKAS